MRNAIKLFTLLFIAAALICLISCNKDTADEVADNPIVNETIESDKIVEKAPFNGEIVKDGTSEYVIIRPDKGGAYDAAKYLAAEIEALTGAKLEIKTDFEKESAGIVRTEKEICIGMTNRDSDGEIASKLRVNDYIITSDASTPERVFIMGGSDSSALTACEVFLQEYSDGNSIIFDEPVEFKAEYEIESFKISEKDISEFSICYASSMTEKTASETFAYKIQSTIAEKTGHMLEIKNVAKCKDGESLILVGASLYSGATKDAADALRANDVSVKVVDGCLFVYGGCDEALSGAVEHFVGTYLSEYTSKQVEIKDEDIYEIPGTYSYNEFSLAGREICEYVIVAENGINNENAIKLRDAIKNVSGYNLGIVAPAYTGGKKAIVFISSGYKASSDAFSEITSNCHAIKLLDGDIYIGANGKLLTDKSLTKYFLEAISISQNGDALSDSDRINISEESLNVEAPAKFDFEIATNETMAEIDAKTDALKKSILESKTEIVPEKDAEVYYVSNSGDNLADGKTPETAWLTLDRVNKAELKEGSYVFFKRGDTFRGNLTALPGVTYSAYGVGEKPIIMASQYNGAQTGTWEETDVPNVYRFNRRFPNDVGLVVFDGGESYAIKITARFIENEPHSDYATGLIFESYKDLPGDMFFYHDLGGPVTTAIDDNHGYLYLRSDFGNPAERFDSIEFNPKNNVIQIKGNGITIDNLHVAHGGSHGVGAGTANDLLVQNCEFSWIGGSLQYYNEDGTPVRFGNAVEIYGSCNNYTVKNCYIHDVYDAGVTHQRSGEGSKSPYIMENVTYENNLFLNCIYSIEYFNQQDDSDENIMRNILFKNNICRNAGGFGWQRPNKVARHIQGGWIGGTREYPAENYVVEGNIFDRSCDVLLSISSNDAKDMPVMNGNTYIQYFGRNYGMVGVPYDKYYPYDANIKNVVNGFTGDKNARVIMILDDVESAYPEDFHVNKTVSNIDKK